MGRKCCVTNRNGNYDNNSKEKVFHLSKNKEEREKWLKIIPRDNTPDSKNTVACETHWPKGYETMQCYGKLRPRYPSSVFTGIKPSLLQTATPLARLTVKTFAEIRNQHPDEFNAFNIQDEILDFKSFTSDISQDDFQCALIVSTVSEKICLQSQELLQDTGILNLC